MRAVLTILATVIFAGFIAVSASSGASISHAPHNENHNVSCADCHADPLPESNRSAVCMTCHGSGGTAPQVMTHSEAVIDGSPGWEAACLDCHDPHFQDQLVNLADLYLITGAVDAYSNNGNGSSTITFTYSSSMIKDGWNLPPHGDNADWSAKTDLGRGLILVADVTKPDETYEIISAVKGPPDRVIINGVISTSPVGNNFGIIYGQLLKSEIYTEAFIAGTGNAAVKYYKSSGENSFADGILPHDGICQVCHENTHHFTRDGDVNVVFPGPGVMDHTNNANTNCVRVCHTHASGFGLGGGGNCESCHENWGSHPVHIETDRGPKLACYDCHNTNSYPLLVDGQDLASTTVCNVCHSEGGSYNGVTSAGDSVGAKDNWISGVNNNYEPSQKNLLAPYLCWRQNLNPRDIS